MLARESRAKGKRTKGVFSFPALTGRASYAAPAGLVRSWGDGFWRRFALDAFVARAAWEKRWQSHRTPKVLGGGGLGKKEILRRERRSSG